MVALWLVWSVTTGVQVTRWGDPLALWLNATQQAPVKPRPLNNLGGQYVLRGRERDAIRSFELAIRLAEHPSRSVRERVISRSIAETNLALLEAFRGEPVAALMRLQRVIARDGLMDAVEVQRWIARQVVMDSP